MPSTDDWYVRLPDGSVVHANSSAAVRHHLETGRLPRDVQVRRSPREPWAALDRFDVFADLAPTRSRPPGRGGDNLPGAHPNLDLEAIGVRGFVERLWTATDAALQPTRLGPAALAGGGLGVAVAVAGLARLLAAPWSVLTPVAAALAAWLLQGWAVVVLSRLTFLELAQLRPAAWREATAGLGDRLTQCLLAQLLLAAPVGGVLTLLRLPWTVAVEEPAWLGPALAAAGVALRLVLEAMLWLLLGLGLLLTPVVVVEECPASQALRQWWALLRQHPGRVVVYEGLALVWALALALPLLLAVAVAAGLVGTAAPAAAATLAVLTGLALAPALAFLAVANVCLYVNLRYESPTRE